MGLRFDPMGGGQFKQALKTIIEVERQPIKNMEVRKAREEARLKLFQDFKTKFSAMEKALDEFTSFKKFRELKVDLGDGANLMSVTVDKDLAEPGVYGVQIDQLAARTSVISNSFEDPDEKVLGIGFIVVNLSNGETAEIFVDEEHASLRGIANLINKAPGSPIRASVIKDMSDPDRPWRLIFAGRTDGQEARLEFPEFYFLDGREDFYIDGENEAQNALVRLDGFPLEASSNTIKDFLQGVNVQLRTARPDQPFTMIITEDFQKIAGKVKGLVDQVNAVLDFINKQNQVDEKSDTRSTFAGDSGLQTIEFRLRNMLHEGFPAGDYDDEENFRFVFLNEIGIEFDKSGLLKLNEQKLTKAMESDFEAVAEAVTGEYGFANQMKAVVAGYTRAADGILTLREQSFRSRIKKIDDDIADKERRIAQREQSLTEKFSRLQASLADLQRQQQYLMAGLPSAGAGGDLVSQLLGK